MRIKDCSYEEAGVKLQDRLCTWLADQGESEVADWFSQWWCGSIKGRWLLANGGYGLVANNQGMESSWRWERNSISGGRQVRVFRSDHKMILNVTSPQVALPIYIANMLKSLKAKSMEDDAQLMIMGHPNAFPSVPKASASDWTIMQSLSILTLRLTMAYRGSAQVWKTAVRELTDGVDDMRVLVRNLKEMERRVSPTSHAAVLLMPTQKFIRQLMDTIDTACEPTGEFTMRAAKFQRIFIDNNMDSRDTLTEALEVYESFHVLEALPSRWSPIHLFKCNCRSCFTHASCAHVLLASMVCDPKIEIPLQYVTTTFQVRRKRGRPARSGEHGKEGDAEEEARKKVHGEGYEVPSVTMRMETVDSDEDFDEPPPPSQVYVDFLSMLISC